MIIFLYFKTYDICPTHGAKIYFYLLVYTEGFSQTLSDRSFYFILIYYVLFFYQYKFILLN